MRGALDTLSISEPTPLSPTHGTEEKEEECYLAEGPQAARRPSRMSSLSSLPLNDVALVPFPTSYTTNTSWQDRVFSQDSSSVTSQSTKLSHSRSSSQSKSMAHLGLIPKPIRTRSITDAKQLPVEVWNLWREIMNASYHEGVVPREIQVFFVR